MYDLWEDDEWNIKFASNCVFSCVWGIFSKCSCAITTDLGAESEGEEERLAWSLEGFKCGTHLVPPRVFTFFLFVWSFCILTLGNFIFIKDLSIGVLSASATTKRQLEVSIWVHNLLCDSKGKEQKSIKFLPWNS